MHYYLHCETCDRILHNIIATTERELMEPDYEQLGKDIGNHVADSLRNFHAQHIGHNVVTLETAL